MKLAFLAPLALAGALAGCNLDPNVATPNQVVIAVNAYNAAVATGTVYLKRPLCPTNAPICRTQAMSQTVYSALKSGRAARAQLLAALANNQSTPITAIQALQAAYSIVQSIPQN